MVISFAKYHGTMNDFIIIDNRSGDYGKRHFGKFAELCQRHSGIGADGVLLLEKAEKGYAYRMRIINPDGNEVDFCGNGARCLYKYAVDNGIVKGRSTFLAGDGPHSAELQNDEVNLKMKAVNGIEEFSPVITVDRNTGIYNSGVEHLVFVVEDVEKTDLTGLAEKYRPDGAVISQGLNINIVSIFNDVIKVRTFERGVEGETYACGTGAAAVAFHLLKNGFVSGEVVELEVKGGKLIVSFPDGLREGPSLTGNAVKVFQGTIEI